ncbi:HAMP domain-containing histidine kinase [Rhodobacteraceae bacterium]|nr:HAMP domain-containing histidine kinase [Paracoccaceae bacterium]
MRSLQRRVIFGGVIWAVLATVIGAVALSAIFSQVADRRFNQSLLERHTQILVAFATAGTPEQIDGYLINPVYDRVYSGEYWQITSANGDRVTSPSLFDAQLSDAEKTEFWESQGPNGMVRGYSERVELDDETVWTVSVASSLSGLVAERAEMRRNVALAFGLVGALGIAGAALLTTVLVAPLRQLREDVTHRWDSGKSLDPLTYPTEVAPLVADINELIARNSLIVERGRRQAADLAHALKTPSSALRNELSRLSRTVDGTAPLFEALDRIDGQITRSLARMRAATAAQAVHVQTDVANSIARMERLFRAIPDAQGKVFDVKSMDAIVSVDAQDLEEMLGNLLENAFKWCRNEVHLSVSKAEHTVNISIEDDGPGIAAKQRKTVMAEGARLDTSMPGTGLGLSIVNDLVLAYGGQVELATSDSLGGLRCTLLLSETTLQSAEPDVLHG